MVCQPLWTANMFGSPQYQTPAVASGRVYTGESNAWEVFDANGVTNCSGSPVTCKPLLRGTIPSGFTEASPVVANGLMLFDDIFDATGTTGCTGSSPAICTPISTGSSTARIDLLAWGTVFRENLSGGLDAYQLRP